LAQRVQGLISTQAALLEELVKYQEPIFFTHIAVGGLIDKRSMSIVRPNERLLLFLKPLEMRKAEGNRPIIETAIHRRSSVVG
jgi:hypothetical protein